MNTWNRLTELRGMGGRGLEKTSQRTYMHIYLAPGHRQPCVEDWVGSSVRGWVDGGKVGNHYNRVNNKYFKINISVSLNIITSSYSWKVAVGYVLVKRDYVRQKE